MPHHWKPLGNPIEDEHLDELRRYLEEHERPAPVFVGRAREDGRVWTLFEADESEAEELEKLGVLKPGDECARTLDRLPSEAGEEGASAT